MNRNLFQSKTCRLVSLVQEVVVSQGEIYLLCPHAQGPRHSTTAMKGTKFIDFLSQYLIDQKYFIFFGYMYLFMYFRFHHFTIILICWRYFVQATDIKYRVKSFRFYRRFSDLFPNGSQPTTPFMKGP